MNNRIDRIEDALQQIIDETEKALSRVHLCRDQAEKDESLDPDAMDAAALEMLELEKPTERISSYARDLDDAVNSVSYTHLTLPTILLV